MKKILTIGIILTLLISCASNNINDYSEDYETEYPDFTEAIIKPKITEDFLGDFDPIEMENLIFLKKINSTLSPKEINSIYLIPRTNTVELTFRDNVNTITVILNKTEREKIISACNTFLQQYDEKTLPHHKVNSKTAYITSQCSLWFGVLSRSTGTSKNDYYINCEFIDKRPYLLLHFIPSRCENKTDVFTPKVSLYLSPTQVKDFIAQISQENLNILINELENKAYTY